ncbi:MAG: PKD domain-containing protein [Bacteroidales bacterium]|nr:PKD domain-containing protein [Bacteroidales bacterium]
MNRIFILTLSLILCFSLLSNSQPWMKNISTENPDFYTIQAAFNKYWEGKTIEKGKGWKQFKRWEYFMEPRVYPSGYLQPEILWKEYLKEKKKNASKDVIANWTALGPFNTPTDINWGGRRGNGRVNCVSFHPTNPNIFYVGSPSGGLWKTTNGGASWITTTDELASMGVSDIAIDPVNPDIIYIATGDGDASDTYTIGILKSFDGGLTWNPTGLSYNASSFKIIRRLIIHPTNPNILIAASNSGVMKTVDGGDSWTTSVIGHFKDVEFKPGDPSVIYASKYSSSQVYKSTDGGDTFVVSSEGLPFPDIGRLEIAVTPHDPNYIYALACNSDDYGFLGVYRSTNSGDTWTEMISGEDINLLGWQSDGSDAGGQGWYDLAIAVSPTNKNVVFVGGVNLWKSTNGGASWSITGHWWGDNAPYVHADQHTLDYNYLTNELFSGNDGGLYKTADGGANWTDLSDGLEILQIYKFGTSATNPNILVTGAQDNGTMKMDNTDWFAILGGDGMECLIDYTNENIMYGEYYYGSMYRSDNGGYDWVDIKPSGSGDGDWVTPYVIDPQNPNILYAGFTELYKSTNKGSTWSVISNFNGALLKNITVAPSDSKTIYVTTNTAVKRTTNGGIDWATASTGLPSNYKTYIAVSQYNPQKLWISHSGYTTGKRVYMSVNGGSSWTNYSDGLPNIPINCLVYENNTNEALYAGTDLGVYYRNNTMSEWIPFSQGLPNVIVTELEIHYATGKLRAATYGRGVWESDLYYQPEAPAANYSYFLTSPCEGEVQFYDISSGIPTSWSWNFGDGQTSTEQNPVHTYSATGTYTVELVVTNALGTNTYSSSVVVEGNPLNTDFEPGSANFCSAPATVLFTNQTEGATNFFWDFGDGQTSNEENPEHTYTEFGEYDVRLITSAGFCEADTFLMSNAVTIDPMGSGNVIMPETGVGETQDCCTGTIKDSGGIGNYQNNTYSTITISSSAFTELVLDFTFFDVEEGSTTTCNNDYVKIWDGPNTASPLIGKFCNTTGSPGLITATNGALTIRQFSNDAVTEGGFVANWYCNGVSVNIAKIEEINIYPNPNNGKFIIEMPNQENRDVFVSIYNSAGKLVFSNVYKDKFHLLEEIEINQAHGLYLVRVSNGIKSQNRVVVVE